MKKLIILTFLTFSFCSIGWSARIITSFDIAHWYLDSDLVIICTVNKLDTLSFGNFDTLYSYNERIQYEMIRELYHVTVDSIIRNNGKQQKPIDIILSQRFSINYSHTEELETKFEYIDSNGDSIISTSFKMYDDFSDNSYFRLGPGKKYIAILSKTDDGYVIDYESECNESFLQQIIEIESKGESYFILQPE